MNVLICEDSRGIGGRNVNSALAKLLERKGHNIRLFEGRNVDDIKILDAIEGGAFLVESLKAWSPDALIVDLHFHEDNKYGLALLAALSNAGILKRIPDDFRIVWSKFENDSGVNYHEILLNSYGFREDRIWNRFGNDVFHVASFF